MRSRVRLAVLAVVTALLAAACGGSSLSSDVAATVNGEEIPVSDFERIATAKAEGLGLVGDDLDRVESAVDAGLLDRDALRQAIQQVVPAPQPELADETVDEIFASYPQVAGQEAVDAGLEETGLSDDAWRDVFGTAARAEYAALIAGIGTDVSLAQEDQVDAAQRQVLSLLIQIEAINQVFVEQDLQLEEGAVDERFQAELERAGGDEQQLADQLVGTGLDVEDYRTIIVSALAQQDAIVTSFVDVDEQQVDEQYDAGIASGRFVTAQVSHILIQPDVAEGETEPTEEALAAAEAEAQDLKSQLDEGADFAALAQEYSDDPGSAAQGGALGEAPLGNYVPEFRDAALEAPIGEVVGPVRSDFGFHLIRVDDRTELSRDEALQQLEDEARQGASSEASSLIQEAFANADIEVAERFGVWDPSTGSVVPEDALGESTSDGATPPPGG